MMLAVGCRLALADVFTIGNSLTWDTSPSQLDDADWHVYCGRNLQFIYDNPSLHCVDSSTPWTVALTQNAYDYVTVQPHRGTTLEQDVNVISNWMEMQPEAVFVLHASWAASNLHPNVYEGTDTTRMSSSAAYFDALRSQLQSLHPGRTLKRTHSSSILHEIAQDISAGQSPYTGLHQLYRDTIHMSYGDGRYLMHNVMRVALNQGLDLAEDDTATPEIQYLNGKLRALVADESVLPGDFNGDKSVNLVDYTIWRDNLGADSEVSLGNAGDGTAGVDSGDYVLWKANFGRSSVVPGDFNGDGSVNLADYAVWRDNLGSATEASIGFAGDGASGVDSGDYAVWKSNFGFRSVVPSLAGDFNEDGVINLADYAVWRDNLGAPTEASIGFAGDGVGGVNAGDYSIWKSNFGTTLSSSAISSQIVAEPGSLALLLAVGAMHREYFSKII